MATGWRHLYPGVEPWVPTILAAKGNGGASGVAGADKGGVTIHGTVQHVMEQSAVQINADGTVVANPLNLPARGPKS
jgi:nicotinic acid phosphoribosyltransferase